MDTLLENGIEDAAAMHVGRALSIDEQWQRIQGWRDYLHEHELEDRPILNSINAQWYALMDTTGMTEVEYGRGKGLRFISGSPLGALFYFVDMGIYPPPELLLGLHDAWTRYMGSGGRISMEDAFFGPSKKGGGNYAKRNRSKFKRMAMALEFAELLRDGKPRKEIAEIISNRRDGKPDADSILRMFRGFNGFTGPKAEK